MHHLRVCLLLGTQEKDGERTRRPKQERGGDGGWGGGLYTHLLMLLVVVAVLAVAVLTVNTTGKALAVEFEAPGLLAVAPATDREAGRRRERRVRVSRVRTRGREGKKFVVEGALTFASSASSEARPRARPARLTGASRSSASSGPRPAATRTPSPLW